MRLNVSFISWALLFVVTPGFGKVYEQLGDLRQEEFDFVVVGGGNAGAVVTSRLSEIEDFDVLLVEAGPSHEGVLNAQVPFLWPALQNSQYDWNFTSTPQVALNNRVLAYSRGHILGGSSSINIMFYTRGAADDYNRWVAVTGDGGWSWNKLLPYFKKHEKWTPPTEPRNISGEYDPSVHGYNGKTLVSLPNQLQSIDPRLASAVEELGGEFRFNLDMNSGYPLGSGWFQGTIGGGQRSSSATAYLSPDVLKRSNLHVLLNTRATRVSPKLKSKKLDFGKVELYSGERKPRTVSAKKEVILSAGAIGSPHILLHSGIGDAQELKKIGITPVHDLPGVGKNLHDHALFGLRFNANTTRTLDTIANDPVLFNQALEQWQQNRTGPMANGASNHVMWLRVSETSPVWKEHVDPSAGPNTPHYELVLGDGGTPVPGQPGQFLISTGIAVSSIASRGSLTLASPYPLDAPLIDPGIFTAEIDRIFAREAIRSSRKFFAAQAWKGYVLDELSESANAMSDEELDEFLRNSVISSWHPVGTAAMSRREERGEEGGVVDPDLKVKGVRGLRVVDASVMPYIIAGHTQAPVYAIAERAADLIKRDWLR